MAIASAIILSAYLIIMALCYGVKKYVSDNYYIGKWPWAFSTAIAVSGGLLLPPMLDKGGSVQFLALFAVFGLMMVAISPHYKVEKMHSVGAIIALVCGIGWALFFHPIPIIGIIALWCIYYFLKFPRPYYIGEVTAFAIIYVTTIL